MIKYQEQWPLMKILNPLCKWKAFK